MKPENSTARFAWFGPRLPRHAADSEGKLAAIALVPRSGIAMETSIRGKLDRCLDGVDLTTTPANSADAVVSPPSGNLSVVIVGHGAARGHECAAQKPQVLHPAAPWLVTDDPQCAMTVHRLQIDLPSQRGRSIAAATVAAARLVCIGRVEVPVAIKGETGGERHANDAQSGAGQPTRKRVGSANPNDQSKTSESLAQLYLASNGTDNATIGQIMAIAGPILLRYLRSCDNGEDIAQDVLVNFLDVAKRNAIKDPRRLLGYLLKTAHWMQVREWERRNRMTVVEFDELRVPISSAQEAEAARLDILRLMEGAKELYVEVLGEYYLEGNRAPEIAKNHGIPEGTVRGRLRRGKEQIQRRHGIEVPKKDR